MERSHAKVIEILCVDNCTIWWGWARPNPLLQARRKSIRSQSCVILLKRLPLKFWLTRTKRETKKLMYYYDVLFEIRKMLLKVTQFNKPQSRIAPLSIKPPGVKSILLNKPPINLMKQKLFYSSMQKTHSTQ